MDKYSLDDISKFIRNGASIKQFDNAKGYPITRIETIANFRIDLDRVGYADIFELSKYEDYLLKKGDILMSHINSEKHLGKSAIVENDDNKIIHGMNLLCIRVDEKLIVPKFLNYYFNHHKFKNKLPKITKKSVNQASFSVTDLKNIEIEVPDIDIQTRTVEVLDKAQELIEKRKEQIEALDELVKSRFIEMFGDPVTNPKGWEKRKLADECNIITGNTPSRKVEEYYGDYIEWIKSDNITNAGVYLTTARECLSEKGLNVGRSVEPNSILMTCIAGSLKCIGNVAIADRKVAFNQQINGIETLDNNVFFMFEQFNLSQAYIQSTINMALKGILSKSQLSELEFIFPPIELQNEFANFFKQVDKLKLEMENSLKDLEDNFNSLMQRAFKGELF